MSAAIVITNTAVALMCVTRRPTYRVAAVAVALAAMAAGPVVYALRAAPPASRPVRLAIVR